MRFFAAIGGTGVDASPDAGGAGAGAGARASLVAVAGVVARVGAGADAAGTEHSYKISNVNDAPPRINTALYDAPNPAGNRCRLSDDVHQRALRGRRLGGVPAVAT